MSTPPPPPYPGPPASSQQGRSTHPALAQGSDNYATEDDLSDNEHPSARHLDVPHIEGMDDQRRRSMEDEERDLPEGWIRQFDEQNGHQFFVDTKANPPRSIWVHPYDDEEYIKSIPDSHPSQQGQQSRLPEQSTHHEMSNTLSASEIRERREAQDNRTKQDTEEEQADRGFGEKLKDKLTGSTKKERDQKKRQRIQQEREMQKRQQEQFLARRKALLEYQQKHRNDPSINRYYPQTSVRYASPLSPYSRSPYAGGGYYGRRGYGGGYGGYGGYGGGGMGMPLMMGGLGGLGGGMMMGSMMGGGFGGGFGGGDCGGGGDGGGGGD